MIQIATHRDYFVAVTQEGDGPDCFCWELRHGKTPMGVKVRVRGFRSSEAAEVAGKTALAEFLEGLSIEESSSACTVNAAVTLPAEQAGEKKVHACTW